MKTVALIATLLFSAACASQNTLQASRDEFNRSLPLGSSKEDCDAKWEAAQVWVAQNIPANIQVVTPVLIQTTSPLGSYLAARVIREPRPEKGCAINISIYCGNDYGVCYPDPWAAAIAFNHRVGAVSAP